MSRGCYRKPCSATHTCKVVYSKTYVKRNTTRSTDSFLRNHTGMQGNAMSLLFSYQNILYSNHKYMNSIKLCMFIFTYNISIIKINSHDVNPSDSFSCSGQRHGESQAAWWARVCGTTERRGPLGLSPNDGCQTRNHRTERPTGPFTE